MLVINNALFDVQISVIMRINYSIDATDTDFNHKRRKKPVRRHSYMYLYIIRKLVQFANVCTYMVLDGNGNDKIEDICTDIQRETERI